MSEWLQPMSEKYTWRFRPRLRSRAFGWRGSHLGCQRLKEAVTEIKKVAKVDPVMAGDGVVILMERIWPAFQAVDTSSGALGSAVNWSQSELLPLLIAAPANRKTREKWLDRLWQAIQDDGVNYLWIVEDRWGELCCSREAASAWADRLLTLVRTAWSDPRPGNYVRGASVCLSSLLAAERYEELLALLALRRFPFWPDRKFGMQAMLQQGHVEEALEYAEASRGLNQPDAAIDAACEMILLDQGRVDEAYEKYALTANSSATGLATFRAIARKYPSRDSRSILLDLATSSGDPGRWFAAAKDAGFLQLAMDFARQGRTDPRTLSRASRDFLEKDARFSLEAGQLAVARILEGYGYELTEADVADACKHVIAAAQTLGTTFQVRANLLTIVETEARSPFRDVVIRQCSLHPLPDGPATKRATAGRLSRR